jgi:hypothetical protein
MPLNAVIGSGCCLSSSFPVELTWVPAGILDGRCCGLSRREAVATPGVVSNQALSQYRRLSRGCPDTGHQETSSGGRTRTSDPAIMSRLLYL